MTRVLIKTILLACIGALSSCATMSEEGKRLSETMRFYENAMRWQDYDFVLSIHAKDDVLSGEKRKALSVYKVTGYDVVYMKMGDDGRSATQIVEIKYYNEEYARVRDLTLKNKWKMDESSMQWYLENPFPKFK